MKSWRQFTSESNATIFVPCACACLSAGQTACGSLPAMTMPAACDWIAAWIAGCCAAAVSSRARRDDLLVAELGERELAAVVGDHLVRVERVLRDEVERLARRWAARAAERGRDGDACHEDRGGDDRPSALVHGSFLSRGGCDRTNRWMCASFALPGIRGGDAAVDVDDVSGRLGRTRARRRTRSPRRRPRGDGRRRASCGPGRRSAARPRRRRTCSRARPSSRTTRCSSPGSRRRG